MEDSHSESYRAEVPHPDPRPVAKPFLPRRKEDFGPVIATPDLTPVIQSPKDSPLPDLKTETLTDHITNTGETMGVVYAGLVPVFGFLVFAGTWIFAINSWGLLLGLALGWIPAAIAGLIAGYLWPIAVGAVIYLLYFS